MTCICNICIDKTIIVWHNIKRIFKKENYYGNNYKRFFLSDMCEYNDFREPSKEKAEALKKRSEILKLLKEHLSSDDLSLLDKYTEVRAIINEEDSYYAFMCGIRATLKILTEIFFSE